MDITNSKKYFIVLLTAFITIPHIHADTNQEIKKSKIKKTSAIDEAVAPSTVKNASQSKGAQAPVTILDAIVDEAKRQLDQTAIILTSLAGMVSNNQIPAAAKKKKEILQSIQQMILRIQKIQHEKFVNIDLATIDSVLRLNNAMMNHVLRALEKGFSDVPPFDEKPIITRKQPSPQGIQQALIKNKKQLETLTKKADHAGLQWFNHAYRALDKYVMAPCNKYAIPRRSLTAFAAFSTVTLLWWRLGNESFKNQAPEWLKNKLGPLPVYSDHGTIENKNELRTFGKLEHYTSELSRGLLPITAAIGALAVGGIADEWGNDHYGLRAKLGNKLSEWDNWLKGGAYLKEAQRIAQRIDEVTFDDLIGLDHVKETFSRLRDYLINPESHDRLCLTPPKGILLVGKTRTGKSYSVKALFCEIDTMLKRQGRQNEFRFIELDAPLINKKGIGYLLSLVKKAAPCLVFIDEIGLLNLQGKGEMLSEFLTCMSGTLDSKNPKNQVIIIGATNRPENLDEALRQPGRFEKELHFEYPSAQHRKDYIRHNLEKLSLSPQMFDIDKLAQDTENKSYEHLNTLINNAIFKARINGEMITQKHLEQTLDEELRHIIASDNKDIPEHEKQILAAHFAGHTVAALLLDMHTKLSKVTIKQVMTDIKEEAMELRLWYKDADDKEQKRFEYGKLFTYHDNDTINMNTREEKLALCKLNLAGIVAEEMLLGSCGYSCHEEDKQRALQLAESLAFEGLDSKQVPKHIYKERYDKALQILNKCEQEIRQLLSQHKDALEAIEHALLENETLTAQQALVIITATENPHAAPVA